MLLSEPDHLVNGMFGFQTQAFLQADLPAALSGERFLYVHQAGQTHIRADQPFGEQIKFLFRLFQAKLIINAFLCADHARFIVFECIVDDRCGGADHIGVF